MGTGNSQGGLNDQQLVEAIRKRDRAAFESLYKRFFSRLHLLAYRYTGQSEEAEEIVHDVFMTIWNKAAVIDIRQSVGSYLAKAVVNTALNHIKKRKSEAEKQVVYNLHVERESQLSAEELDGAILVKLAKALEELPPQCKKVMMMSRFQKMKQQQIADELQISIKTVKNHLTYGFQKMRLAMTDQNIATFCLLLTVLYLFI
jgi:RNA polymerase sigma-70 factor (family 1)